MMFFLENMENIKEGDYVILLSQLGELVKNSVGLVEKTGNNRAVVFFLGKQKRVGVDISQLEYLDVKKTGKPYKYKICNVCYILKEDVKDFDINQTDASGRKTTRPTCNECRKAIDGIALKASEKKRMEQNKPEKYFVCPICHKASIPGVTAHLVIDHNHNTGNARAWICDSCNTGLGRFKDDINLMEEAIKYLKKYSDI